MQKNSCDCNGNSITVGDSVKLVSIPVRLLEGLLQDDQIAIHAQLGRILIIEGFDLNSYAELEFFDAAGYIHTIWIEPCYLEKFEKA